MTEKPLINKVAQKAIIQIDPVSFLPKATEIVAFDMKPFLYKELILREKEYREALLAFDFKAFEQKYVYVFCSSDAIIPMWAYMLLTTYLNPIAKEVVFANTIKAAEESFLLSALNKIDVKQYQNKRIVIKGCGEKNFSPQVYVKLVRILQEETKAISFGEACSMVPVFKK